MTFIKIRFSSESHAMFNFRLFSLLQSGIVSQSFFDFHNFDAFEDYRPDILSIVLHLGLVCLFLTLDSGYTFSRNNIEVMLCSSHYMLLRAAWFWIVPLLLAFTLITWLNFCLLASPLWIICSFCHESTLKLCKYH